MSKRPAVVEDSQDDQQTKKSKTEPAESQFVYLSLCFN